MNLNIYSKSGGTIYAILFHTLDGKVWNNDSSDGGDWENNPSFAETVVEVPEIGTTGRYEFSWPTGISTGTMCDIVFRVQSGDSPNESEDDIYNVLEGQIKGAEWNF